MDKKNSLLLGSIATSDYQPCALPPGSDAMGSITSFSASWSWANSSWLLAAGTHDGVEIWLFNSKDALAEAHNADFRSGEIIYVSPDSKLIAAMNYLDSDINIIAAETSEVARVLIRKNTVRRKPAFSPDSSYLASQTNDTDNIHIWNINTGTVIQELQGQGYNGTTVAFSYGSSYLVAGYYNATGNSRERCEALVRIWCVESGQNLYEFGCQVGGYGIETVAISAGLELVAISDLNYEVQLWEPRTGHCICKIFQWDASDLTFSSDSTLLAVISFRPAEVKIWETATGACLFRVGDACINFIASFDPLTGNIVTADSIFKNSAWKHWHGSQRQGYSYSPHRGCWIRLDGRDTLFIPFEFEYGHEGCPVISDSLMAYTSGLDQLIIIKFPDRLGLEGQETKMLDADGSSRPGLDMDITSKVDAVHLAD